MFFQTVVYDESCSEFVVVNFEYLKALCLIWPYFKHLLILKCLCHIYRLI